MTTDFEEQSEVCSRCGQPKGGSGRLTQWIKVCSCLSVPDSQVDTDVRICDICGKRIATGRAGSFTQWVFRSDLCSCKKIDTAAGAAHGSVDDEFDRDHENDHLYEDRIPVARYRVIREIGRGGAGTIYLCRDRALRKNVAIKSINVLERETLMAFQREARATSKLSHPHIVQIIDFGTTGSGVPYMVLEHFDGINLEKYMAEHGALPYSIALSVFSQVLDALEYAHNQDVLHRDVKPGNILVANLENQNIEVKLIDFGIAALVQSIQVPNLNEENSKAENQYDTVVGTPSYMSPDQGLGYSYDERSEVYSLGCLLFGLLTGRPPFQGSTPLETLSMHSTETPPTLADTMDDTNRPDSQLLEILEAFVKICLAKDPESRFQSVKDLRKRFSQSVFNETDEPETHGTGDPLEMEPEPTKHSRNYLVLSAVTAIIVLIICAVVYLPSLFKSEQETTELLSHVSGIDDAPNYEEGRSDMIIPVNGHMWHAFVDPKSDRALNSMKNIKNMNSVWLITTIDRPMMDYLGTLKLRGLGIEDATIFDLNETIESVSKMHSIVVLVLLQSEVSDYNLSQISKMPELRHIAILSKKVTDEGIAKLRSLPRLKGLGLSSMKQISDKSIDVILSLPHISRGGFGYTSITAGGAIRLIKSGKFTGISLGGLPITKEVMKALNNSSVRNLSLMSCKIDEKTMEQLAAMKQLRILDVRSCKSIDEAVARRFHRLRQAKGFPSCKVYVGQNSNARDWDIMIDDDADPEEQAPAKPVTVTK